MAQSRLARGPGDELFEEEEHEFFWTFQTSGLISDLSGQTFAFRAGRTFGAKCKWEFNFISVKGDMFSPILGLRLVECDRLEEISAKMRISLTGDGPQVWKCDRDSPCFTKASLSIHSECKFSEVGADSSLAPRSFGYIARLSPDRVRFRLHIKFTLRSKVAKKKDEEAKPNIPKSTMLAMLENRDQNADVTFKTKDGLEIVAHRNILSAQSDVFKTMFATEMTEKKEGVVELADLSGPGFKIFLKFVYTGELDDNWGDFWDEVVYAAGKYQVAALTDLCDVVLPTLTTWENCVQLLDVAELHGLPRAEEKIKKFMKSDPDKMLEAFRSGPPSAKKSRPNV